MSFLSELFHGNVDWGNLAPQNLFKDTVSSFENQPEWAKIAEIALPAVALGGVGLGALADVGGVAAAGGLGAAEGAAAGAPLDILAGGAAAGTAGETAGAIGAGGLSALTPADVNFLDPTLFGEASAPGAVPPMVGDAAVPFTDPISMGAQVQVGAPGGFAGGGVSPADWASAASQSLIPGGGGGGGGGDFAAIQSAVDPGVSGLTGGTAQAPDLGYAVYSGGNPIGVQGAAPFAPTEAPAPQGFVENLTSSFNAFPGQLGKALGNPLTDLGIAGLGAGIYSGYQSQQQLKALQQQEADYQNRIASAGQASLRAAGPMMAAGQALTLGTGPVPAPMQAILDNFRNAERARVLQSYSGQGVPADPTKNTALAQDLNAVDNQMLALREKLGEQILTTANTMLASGASATEIAARLPIMMQELDMKLQQMTGNAIANFAAAMSGGTMRVAGQGTGQNLNINFTGGTGTVA